MAPDGDKLIFGRYSRDECGLPPAGGRPRRGGFVVGAALLLAALTAAGWLAGTLVARWREAWVNSLAHRVRNAAPSEVPGLLARGRMYAAALPDNLDVRRDLAIAGLVAAEQSPRRMGYYGNLGALFAGLDDVTFSSPGAEFVSRLSASGVYAELGDYAGAFAALAAADKALAGLADERARRSHRLPLVNAQAYYLATAPVSRGGNPEKALHLAQLLVSSRDELAGGGHASASAAFLDTLATAWHAAGDDERALATQFFALGLADSSELDVYLSHFDEFSGSKPE